MNKKGIIPIVLGVPVIIALIVGLIIALALMGVAIKTFAPQIAGAFVAVVGLILVMNIKSFDAGSQKTALVISILFIVAGVLTFLFPNAIDSISSQTFSIIK